MNVLVVDDMGINRRLLRALLEAENIQVCEAADGIEALGVLERESVDLLITDILMPRMDGYRLCYEIRRNAQFKSLPILVYSATYTSPADEKLSLDIGADRFLRKPSSAAVLLGVVAELTALPAQRVVEEPRLTDEAMVMREYSEQLVSKLSEKNEALVASEEEYRLLFQHSMDAIVQTSVAGDVLRANAAACRMFGLEEIELLQCNRSRLLAFSDSRCLEFLSRLASDGMASGVMRAKRGDGSLFECELSAARYASADQVIRTTVVLRDLTGQIEAETTRRTLEARLSQASKMEAVGQMAAGVAHDFNNIVAAILGNTTLMARNSDDAEQARVSLGEIEKAGRLAREMVRNLLAFARGRPQDRMPIPLGPVLQEQAGLLRVSLLANVSFDLELPQRAVWVNADAAQLGEVVMNLCTNACHAAAGGGARVSLGLETGALATDVAWPLEGPRDGQFACIRVSDNGPGMDPATQRRIFEPFFTTKPRGEGTGLGLSMVMGIVKAHDGTIRVQSAPGQGTTFTVYLPLIEHSEGLLSASPVPAAVAPAGSLADGRGRRLAYLDDYEGLVFLVTRALRGLGYAVSGYEYAEDLLAALRADPAAFDVVVTDYNMPGLSGVDVTRAVKLLCPAMPVLITSGFVNEQLQVDARQAGAVDVIYKANGIDELCESIRRALVAHV